jgi:hypothetical protein
LAVGQSGSPVIQNRKRKANRMLQVRLQAIASGEPFRVGIEKIKVSELAEDFLQDYRINRRKSLPDASDCVSDPLI